MALRRKVLNSPSLLCSVPSCNRPVRARSLCITHYNYQRYHGSIDDFPCAHVSRVVSAADYERRFWSYVDITSPDNCWLWQGCLNRDGYGVFVTPSCTSGLAHRFAYELFREPIPDGLETDHLCRVRRCCNPAHMEAVSHKENNIRGNTLTAINAKKTHCIRGHPYDAENTYITKNGSRNCRTCHRAQYEAKRFVNDNK